MENWDGFMLPYLAVGRVKDNTVLAQCIIPNPTAEQEKTEDVFRMLLAASEFRLVPGERTRLMWDDGCICAFLDQGNFLYCVVTAHFSYPEKLAYMLLADLAAAVIATGIDLDNCTENSLNSQLGTRMLDLLESYGGYENYQHALVGAGEVTRRTLLSFDIEDGLSPVSFANEVLFEPPGRAARNHQHRIQQAGGVLGVLVLLILVVLYVQWPSHTAVRSLASQLLSLAASTVPASNGSLLRL